MLSVEDILVPAPEPGVTVDPVQYFASPGPVELEIGSGKGGFLLERARQCPAHRLLGIEWANKYCRHAADRMARWGMTNVRLMRTDAGNFMIHHLAPDTLTALHIYHPDPWPKKRHHKRRLLQPVFVEAVVRALRPGGWLAVQTDHAEYSEWIRDLLQPRGELAQVDFEHPGFLPAGQSPRTNFEVKYVREGRTIYRMAYLRRPAATPGTPHG